MSKEFTCTEFLETARRVVADGYEIDYDTANEAEVLLDEYQDRESSGVVKAFIALLMNDPYTGGKDETDLTRYLQEIYRGAWGSAGDYIRDLYQEMAASRFEEADARRALSEVLGELGEYVNWDEFAKNGNFTDDQYYEVDGTTYVFVGDTHR